jgi:hypothetical protein
MNKRLLLLFILSLGACAFTNPKNTPLVTKTDALLTADGEDSPSWLFLPLAVPLGLVDTLIIHPAMVLDDAWDDTWELLWEPEVPGTAMRSYLMIPRVTLTPVIFGVDWLLRALFDVDANSEEALKLSDEERRQMEIERLRIDIRFFQQRALELEAELQQKITEPK